MTLTLMTVWCNISHSMVTLNQVIIWWHLTRWWHIQTLCDDTYTTA